MKIRRKPTWLKEDCFEASEGTRRVKIYTHRHTVLIDVDDGERIVQHELSLPIFAEILAEAVQQDKIRVHGVTTP